MDGWMKAEESPCSGAPRPLSNAEKAASALSSLPTATSHKRSEWSDPWDWESCEEWSAAHLGFCFGICITRVSTLVSGQPGQVLPLSLPLPLSLYVWERKQGEDVSGTLSLPPWPAGWLRALQTSFWLQEVSRYRLGGQRGGGLIPTLDLSHMLQPSFASNMRVFLSLSGSHVAFAVGSQCRGRAARLSNPPKGSPRRTQIKQMAVGVRRTKRDSRDAEGWI